MATYEDFPQWENGVGFVRSFLDEAAAVSLPLRVSPGRRVVLAGGTLAMEALEPLWARLRGVRGLTVRTIALANHFFGPGVTVSGLLTGKCLVRGLGGQGLDRGETVYLPGVMLKDGCDVFLDDLSVGEVEAELGLRLVFLPGGAADAIGLILRRENI